MKGFLFRVIIAVASFTLFFELAVRIADLDMVFIKPLLYYQCADPEVHRISRNPELLYELKPNAVRVDAEKKVTINSLGYRDRERKKEKDKDVFRIICFGGSNTYGAMVNDNETYTRRLEELLNGRSKRKYEVWNAGCSAYVLSQDIETARQMIREYQPDLLIFQRSNTGRRAFLERADYRRFLRVNPYLYRENLRFFPFAAGPGLARWLFTHSCSFRTIVVFMNCVKWCPSCNPLYNSEKVNEEKFIRFYREINPHIPVVVWQFGADTENIRCGGQPVNTINVFASRYYPKGMGKEYFLIHPPAHVYRWYAKTILKELERKKLL